MTEREVVVVGWDQSINHAAAVALDWDGRVVAAWGYDTKPGIVKSLCEELAHLPGPVALTRLPARYADRAVDASQRHMHRLAWLHQWQTEVVEQIKALAHPDLDGGGPIHTIEDYAYGAAGSAHQVGEVQGSLRLALLQRRAGRIRLHSPTSVKLFACNDGHASKEQVQEAVASRWGFLAAAPNVAVQASSLREDLADAFVLARMGWAEQLLRLGELQLKDLHESERRVFLRVTKTNPTNVLDRPLVSSEVPSQQQAKPQQRGIGKRRN